MRKFIFLIIISTLFISCNGKNVKKEPAQSEIYDYYISCLKGDIDSVKQFLSEYPEYVDSELVSDESDYSYQNFAKYLINEKIVEFSDDEAEQKLSFIKNYKRKTINIAAKYGKLDVLRVLIENDAYINAKDEYEYTPLISAVSNSNIEIVRELLRHNPALYEKNDEDFTALALAVYYKENLCVEELLKNGANTEIQTQNFTPLGIAIIYDNEEARNLLLDYGADVNAKTKDGLSVLQIAAQENKLDSLQLLIKKGADINHRNVYGATALMLAAYRDNFEIVRALVKQGADVNAVDNTDYNVLVYAADAHDTNKTDLKVINYLLSIGVNSPYINTSVFNSQTQTKKSTKPSDNFKYKLSDDGNGVVILKYIGSERIVEIPKEIEGFPVIQIGQYESIFKDFNKTIFDQLIIPDTVTSIKWDAFANANIRKITIPDSVRDLDASAISNIGYLEELKLPSKIDMNNFHVSFASTCNLSEVIIPTSAKPTYYTSITVNKQSKIKRVVFSEGIKAVGVNGNIKNIKEIVLPNSTECFTGRVLLNSTTKFVIPFQSKQLRFRYTWDPDFPQSFLPYIADNCSLSEQKEIQDTWKKLGFLGYFAEESIF